MVAIGIDINKLIYKVKRAAEKRQRSSGRQQGRPMAVPAGAVPLEGEGASGRAVFVRQRREEEEEEEEKEEYEKIDLPRGGMTAPSKFSWEEEEEQVPSVERKYPLLPQNPKKGEIVYAWAYIHYNEQIGSLQYELVEPETTPEINSNLERIENLLKETIDVDFGELRKEEAKKFLRQKILQIINEYEFGLSNEQRETITYYATRDFTGLGQIEPLMNDPEIEDISCDGVGVPVYVYHRDRNIGSIPTNVQYNDEQELNNFVLKLAQRCGRSVSVANPLLDGSLPDGSRVQATLATDIARRGSNFTVRKFTKDPLTPINLMELETINEKMLAYLWYLVDKGKSVLVAGPTASGKTTLLNALSLFIPPGLKVISIEDTPELRLPHPNWVPEVSRSGFGHAGGGGVSLDDLLKESLRQRPDYIIVGEVRGEEAYILFQQIATGHPGLSTIHASSFQKVINRLTTRPINLPPTLIESLDVLAFIRKMKKNKSEVRKVESVYELKNFKANAENPDINQVFRWDASQKQFVNPSSSALLGEVKEQEGISKKEMQYEISKRERILRWMADKGIKDYRKVGKVISSYYSDPSRVMNVVEEETFM